MLVPYCYLGENATMDEKDSYYERLNAATVLFLFLNLYVQRYFLLIVEESQNFEIIMLEAVICKELICHDENPQKHRIQSRWSERAYNITAFFITMHRAARLGTTWLFKVKFRLFASHMFEAGNKDCLKKTFLFQS